MGNTTLIFALILALLPFSGAYAQTPPKVASESYILLDADTGAILAEKNADLRLPPASLTKIMTAYMGFRALAENALASDQKITVSSRAWAQNVPGSKTFLEVNSEVSVRDLLFGIIVQSGNDASIALAEGLSGDESAFVAAMNEQAAQFGLKNTHFTNTTGLPDEMHYSSARDVAEVIRRTVREFPQDYKIYAEREFTYNDITQPNRNALLDAFRGADGVKTGYTKAAGYCLAASAVRDGRRLISVVMKTKSPAARKRESVKLLTFGFSHFKNVLLFDEAKTRELPLFEGEKDTIAAHPEETGLITIPRGATAEAAFTPVLPLLAPLSRGAEVGAIEININGEPARKVKIVAAEDVAEAGAWKKAVDFVKWRYLGHGDAVLSEW
ncbi:MAG: D-alanyl-D-alanine carboxypeptidase family protein [Gammaproteobacteria bacterium]